MTTDGILEWRETENRNGDTAFEADSIVGVGEEGGIVWMIEPRIIRDELAWIALGCDTEFKTARAARDHCQATEDAMAKDLQEV